MVTASYGTITYGNRHQCKARSMACAVINNGKPTGNTLFRMEGGRMSILTKTSRRRTCFEGYSYL